MTPAERALLETERTIDALVEGLRAFYPVSDAVRARLDVGLVATIERFARALTFAQGMGYTSVEVVYAGPTTIPDGRTFPPSKCLKCGGLDWLVGLDRTIPARAPKGWPGDLQ